jgi:hypothetical protein
MKIVYHESVGRGGPITADFGLITADPPPVNGENS